jgi:uncharacterized metal-binding protein YceD (DUF177 family)
MELKIYIDRLKDGKLEKLSASVPTAFLDTHDAELSFQDTLTLSGEAYIANDHLILRLKAKTSAYIPCTICNQPVEIPIFIDNFYHAKPLREIPSAVFDFSEELRDDILLQIPQFAECNQGHCLERENMKKYLKDEPSPTAKSSHFQYPFSDLES